MDSELLFLLIIILTVVINIVKAVKKKKAQAAQVKQPESTTGTPQAGDWQKMLKDLLGETSSVPRPVSVDENIEADSLETLEPLGGYIQDYKPYNFDKPEYTRSTIGDEVFDVQPAVETVPEQGYMLNKTQARRMHETLKEFDIRKAVIYSTILNRPYN